MGEIEHALQLTRTMPFSSAQTSTTGSAAMLVGWDALEQRSGTKGIIDFNVPGIVDADTSSTAFELAIVAVEVDEHWSYWVDGAGSRFRLRPRYLGLTTVYR
jgi:hypothetical protein